MTLSRVVPHHSPAYQVDSLYYMLYLTPSAMHFWIAKDGYSPPWMGTCLKYGIF